jgi:hypothetical protein
MDRLFSRSPTPGVRGVRNFGRPPREDRAAQDLVESLRQAWGLRAGSKKIEPREQCAPRSCVAWANAEPNGRPRCNLQEAVKRTSRRHSRFNVGPGQFTRQVGFEDSLEYVATVAVEDRTTLEHAQNN